MFRFASRARRAPDPSDSNRASGAARSRRGASRRALGPLALTALLALGLSACGVRSGGHCTDYEPVTDCSDGYHKVCQTTRRGCRQCGCVARSTSGGSADFNAPD